MNIDERIEKLTERHEALAQTVELIAGQVSRTESRLEHEMRLVRLEES